MVAAMLPCCVSSSTDWCPEAAEQPDPVSTGSITGARARTARKIPAASTRATLAAMTVRRLAFLRCGGGWRGRLLGTSRSYRRALTGATQTAACAQAHTNP